jgi:hypothetical protein
MAVYVDESRIPWRGRSWSHLTADTSAELHAFAARLGVPDAGFHSSPSRPWKDHYDLPDSKRAEAVRLGARPITRREAVKLLRAKRAAHRRGETAQRPASFE